VAVLSVVRQARALAAAGQGATLVEAVLPGTDGPDPLARMRRLVESRGLWSEDRDRRLREEVAGDVSRAIDEARATPPPARSTLFDDVYAEKAWHLREEESSAG
jgi:TPP-dependent pyruvate/acetoin dehydrogenase alpha subunit